MSTEKETTSRRGFLKLATTAAPLGAVAMVSGTERAEASAPDIKSDTIQDTAHTRAYYETARF